MAKNIILGVISILLMVSLGFNYYQYQQMKPFKSQVQNNLQFASGTVVSVDAKNIKIKTIDKEMEFSINGDTKVFRNLADMDQMNILDAKIADIQKDSDVNIGYSANKPDLAARIDIYIPNTLTGNIISVGNNIITIDQAGQPVEIKLSDKTTYSYQEYIKEGTVDKETQTVGIFKPGSVKSLVLGDIKPGQMATVFLTTSATDSNKTASKVLIIEYK